MILLAFYGLIVYNKLMKRISCFTSLCLCFCVFFTIKSGIAGGISYAYVAPVEESNVDNNYTIHIVENGDNLYRIGLKYKVAQKDIIEFNKISNNHIFVGQKLKIPVKKEKANHVNGDVKNQSEDVIKDIAVDNKHKDKMEDKKTEKMEDKNSVVANPNLNKVVKTSSIAAQDTNIVNQIEPTTFIWPARGVVLSHFGHLTKTGRLEGINIGGENGSLVKASASGKIVYNDKVDGFGNVILVQHYNGFITAYGYTDPLVATGDRVKKGQVIAYMKNDKQSKRSILYFSIRKNGKCYDPEKVIATKISN